MFTVSFGAHRGLSIRNEMDINETCSLFLPRLLSMDYLLVLTLVFLKVLKKWTRKYKLSLYEESLLGGESKN